MENSDNRIKTLFEMSIAVSGKITFRLFMSENNKEPNLTDLEPIIREWSNDTDEDSLAFSGKSLVRFLREKGYIAFTESQLNKYKRNAEQNN